MSFFFGPRTLSRSAVKAFESLRDLVVSLFPSGRDRSVLPFSPSILYVVIGFSFYVVCLPLFQGRS